MQTCDVLDDLADVSSSDDNSQNNDFEGNIAEKIFGNILKPPVCLTEHLRRKYEQYNCHIINPYYAEKRNILKILMSQKDTNLKKSWFSVTPELIAKRQADVCKCDLIIDAFCGVGGNSIHFAKTCGLVVSIEHSFPRLMMLKNNANIYGVSNRIMPICGDVNKILSSLRIKASCNQHQGDYENRLDNASPIDAIFLSPPWGGPSYTGIVYPPGSGSWNKRKRRKWLMEQHEIEPMFNLDDIGCLNSSLSLAKHLTNRILIYLPRNSSIGQLIQLSWPIECEQTENSGCCLCQTHAPFYIESYRLRGKFMSIGLYLGYFPELAVDQL